MTPDWRPPHAYIPGQSPRHPEELFDWIKADIETLPMTQLRQSLAWRMGLCFLEEGFFWEAHEVLEPIWMACPQNSAERALVQAVIQLANAGLKQRMGRLRGRDRLLAIARAHAAEAFRRAGGEVLGLHELPQLILDSEYAK